VALAEALTDPGSQFRVLWILRATSVTDASGQGQRTYGVPVPGIPQARHRPVARAEAELGDQGEMDVS
jgi:hypothetical protein